MFRIRLLVCSLTALFLAQPILAAPAPEKKATAEDVAKAEKAVKDYLEKKKGAAALVQVVKDEPLARAFPAQVFVTALFRQFPVGRPVPEGLKASNVFAYNVDGKLELLPTGKELEAFFKSHQADAKKDDAAKDLARSWIRLSQEYSQDGFYKFALQDDSTKVASADKGKTVSARTVVMQGGNGELSATLTLDEAGKLVKVSETRMIRPGPRPICQATKLLDADPLVRRMAEQDLLIMGRFAEGYLKEQRAKAKPELQQAIDRLWQRIQAEQR